MKTFYKLTILLLISTLLLSVPSDNHPLSPFYSIADSDNSDESY